MKRTEGDNVHTSDFYYGALDAFFPGTLALKSDSSQDLDLAEMLHEASNYMWDDGIWGDENPNTHKGLMECDEYHYEEKNVCSRLKRSNYFLRPEIIESAHYLYHCTKIIRIKMI